MNSIRPQYCSPCISVMLQLRFNWNMAAEPCYYNGQILIPSKYQDKVSPFPMGNLASKTDFSCWQRSSHTYHNLFIPTEVSVKNWINRYTFVIVNTICETPNWKASTASSHSPTPTLELSEINFSLVLLILNTWALFKVLTSFCPSKNSQP